MTLAVEAPHRDDPMVPLTHRVLWKRRETVDTFTFALEPVSGPPVDFRPGQYNMLYAFGVGEVPISISGDPAGGPLIHTVRAVGAVSGALARVKENTVVGVRGPFGTDWRVEEAAGRDVVVVAGGIGLAPLRPAIYRLLAERPRYRKVSILIGARSPSDLIYRKEIGKWRTRLDLDIEVTVDHAPTDWRGRVGVVTELFPRAAFDPENTVALVCGPEIMIRFAARGLVDRGVAGDQILVSMERNMKCGVGYCGHCQFGPEFVCWNGPVFSYQRVERLLGIREV